MECKYCTAKLIGESWKECPICGSILSFQEEKPSFQLTWAQIYSDTLKRQKQLGKIQDSDYEKALESYIKLVEEKPENIGYLLHFLQEYPLSEEKAKQIRPGLLSFFQEENGDTFIEKVIAYGMKKHQPAAMMHVFDLPQNSFQEQTIQALLSRQDELSYSVRARLYAHQQKYQEALVSLLLAAGKGGEDRTFVLTPLLKEKYFPIPETLEKRMQWLEESRNRDDLFSWTQGMIRPLLAEEETKTFDHLNHLNQEDLTYLRDNYQAWVQLIHAMIETKVCLRGIHLLLQRLKREEQLSQKELNDLLEFHFQKVYMVPFDVIAASDALYSGCYNLGGENAGADDRPDDPIL